MRKRLAAILLVSLLVAVFVAGCGGARKTYEFKMSVVTSEESSWYKGAVKFGDLVKEGSNGRITVQVFPNAQLGGGNQVKELEMLQNGAIDLTYHSTILYTNIDPRFTVISMPWLLPDTVTADKFTTGPLGQELFNILSDKGIVGLAYGENGFRQLTNSKKAVASPADMKGLKIRIPGIKMYTSIYQTLGANPTVMNFTEVFGALQQGVIDGQENPLDVITSSKLYEVQKNITLWNYSYDAIILGMNKAKYDALSEADKKLIKDAAVAASKYQVEQNRAAEAEKLQLLKDKGMTVTELTPGQIKAFQDMMAPVYAEYEPIIGKELLDKFRALSQ